MGRNATWPYAQVPHFAIALPLDSVARFPLISPAAAFRWSDTVLRHYVDGGYYENKGVETKLQVLEAVKAGSNHLLQLPEKKQLWVRPYVLQFNFGDPDDPNDTADLKNIKPVKNFNELKEVLVGIYNTRNGRGRVQQVHLTNYLQQNGIVPIPFYLPLSERRVPMNWILSNAALDTLYKYAEQLAQQKADSFWNKWEPPSTTQ